MPNFGYREMLEIGKPFKPEAELLDKLALCMSGLASYPQRTNFHDSDLPKTDKSIISALPAGYTYLGQFIDHDISFDSFTDDSENRPWGNINPASIKNLRSPDFNLETVYGIGTPKSTNKFPPPELMQNGSRMFLRLGDTFKEPFLSKNSKYSYSNDLPRKAGTLEADIVDPRNDENLIVAQTQVAFIKFHNAVVLKLKYSEKYNDEVEIFEAARRIVIRHYQYIILEDFLRKIVKESVLEDVKKKVFTGDLYYQPTRSDMFMPLEFSAAAFRAGHSMIKNKYRLNIVHDPKLNELMVFTGRGGMEDPSGHKGILNLPSSWIINWYSFYDIDNSNFNAAEKIDTNLATLLQMIPSGNNPTGRSGSLAAIDLFRARALGLPTGQDVARVLGVPVLPGNVIADLLRSKKINDLSANASQIIKEELIAAFKDATPLWFYILAEAEIQNLNAGFSLGETGSIIVAETIIKLLHESEFSILKQKLETDDDFLAADRKTFGMPEMLKFIRDTNRKYFSELYPGRSIYFDELNPLGDSLSNNELV